MLSTVLPQSIWQTSGYSNSNPGAFEYVIKCMQTNYSDVQQCPINGLEGLIGMAEKWLVSKAVMLAKVHRRQIKVRQAALYP